MAILVKKIKASRLNEDAMAQAITAGMQEVGKEMKKEFEKTTRTWKNKPDFEIIEAITPNLGKVEVAVMTDDEIYGYVNDGTPEHIITPRKPDGFLWFKWAGPPRGVSYTSKTKPRQISSGASQTRGTLKRFNGVIHPGTEAREFDETIAEYMQPRFKRAMEKAMSRAAKASGHKI